MAEARSTFPDAQYAEMLQDVREWQGSTPKSLADVPSTPLVRKRLNAVSPKWVDFDLSLLADLEPCFQQARIPAGGSAVVGFFFDLMDGRAVAKEPVVEASTVHPEYEEAFESCLRSAFEGKSVPFQADPGTYTHVVPMVIPVPAHNHTVYRWLFVDEPGTN